MSILQNDAQTAAQIVFIYRFYVQSVISYFARLYIVKTVDKICNRGFTRTCRAYKSNLLPRLCIKADIFKNYLFFRISENYVFKTYICLLYTSDAADD